MVVGASDINIVFSGGAANIDPAVSLGGDPSNNPIPNAKNNLFDDVAEDEALNGRTDYRAFYVVNNNSTDSLFDVEIFVQSEVEDGANMFIGVSRANDIQTISVQGSPTGGNIGIEFEAENGTANYNANVDTFAANIQATLRSFTALSEVVVTGTTSPPDTMIFTVSFEGADGERFHEQIIVTNNLTFVGSPPIVSSLKIQDGAPVNQIAPTIANQESAPIDVEFNATSEASPLSLGILKASDVVPVWVRRVTPIGASAVADDGFVFRVSGNPIAST